MFKFKRFRLLNQQPVDGGTGGSGEGSGTPAPAGGAAGGGGGNASGAAGAAGKGAAGAGGENGAGGVLDRPDGGGAGGGSPAPAAAKWAETWREDFAKDDKSRLNVLKRYSDPNAALDALFTYKRKVDSGEVLKPLPENATEEQIKQYRADRGIPEKPEDYKINLPKGVEMDDGDETVLAALMTRMHKVHAPQSVVDAAVAAFYDMQDEVASEQLAAVQRAQEETREILREEWGPEYKANINIVKNFLSSAPKGVYESIVGSRDANGVSLADNPVIVKWLNGLAREINPMAGVLPSGDGNMKAVETEMADLRKMMGDKSSAYWKGPDAAKNQARYRELISFQSRTKAA